MLAVFQPDCQPALESAHLLCAGGKEDVIFDLFILKKIFFLMFWVPGTSLHGCCLPGSQNTCAGQQVTLRAGRLRHRSLCFHFVSNITTSSSHGGQSSVTRAAVQQESCHGYGMQHGNSPAWDGKEAGGALEVNKGEEQEHVYAKFGLLQGARRLLQTQHS